MIVAFGVAPSGGESDSVSAASAQAVQVVADSGLPYELNAIFGYAGQLRAKVDRVWQHLAEPR